MLGLFFFVLLLIAAFRTRAVGRYAAPRSRSGARGGIDRAHSRCRGGLLRRDLFRDLPDGLLLLAPPRNRRDVRPHIVLNTLALHAGGSGVQTYCRELLRALPSEIDADLTAVVQRRGQAELPAVCAGAAFDRIAKVCGARSRACAARGPADLVHALDVDLPLRPGAPSVATVHDLSLFDEPSAFGWARRAREAGRRRAGRSVGPTR